MARPTVHATTERIYSFLPALYRDADAQQGAGTSQYPLLRYSSLQGDQLGAVLDVLDSLGLLGDPELAPAAWLRYQAQFGARIDGLSERDARTAIATIATRTPASSESLLAAIRARLSGPQRVGLIRHIDGDMWLLGVQINPDDVVATSWDAVEAEFPDWASIESAGSWDGLGDIDPLSSPLVEQNTPVGVELVAINPGSWVSIEMLPDWDAVEALGSWDAVETYIAA